jgi:hypothetical protein
MFMIKLHTNTQVCNSNGSLLIFVIQNLIRILAPAMCCLTFHKSRFNKCRKFSQYVLPYGTSFQDREVLLM